MIGRMLSIRSVGQLFGLVLPEPGRKSKCPFREHKKRKDATFRVYLSRSNNHPMWKCWSCDPPDNVGDSIALYARLAGCERKDAWKKLKDEGFAVPGAEKGRRGNGSEDGGADRRAYEQEQKKVGYGVLPCGTQPKLVLQLDETKWKQWAQLSNGGLKKFASMRKLPVDFLRQHGVIELPGGKHVGFTYFDPKTGAPCRVKVRGIEEKSFFILPRPDRGQPDAKALGPLYLAHDLKPDGGPVVIVEGEIDALTLRYVGIRNVVSLPDGADSAKTVSFEPLLSGFAFRLVATDHDKAGVAAFRTIRARAYGQDSLRVNWRRMIGVDELEDIESYKDANDALKDGGFTRDNFLTCLKVAAEDEGYLFSDWMTA